MPHRQCSASLLRSEGQSTCTISCLVCDCAWVGCCFTCPNYATMHIYSNKKSIILLGLYNLIQWRGGAGGYAGHAAEVCAEDLCWNTIIQGKVNTARAWRRKWGWTCLQLEGGA